LGRMLGILGDCSISTVLSKTSEIVCISNPITSTDNEFLYH
jgi:hypothetical protein